ncbi:MAG: serine hydrolase [Filifactor alocis]|nr:serine hydrolase [Filifactor alocis]
MRKQGLENILERVKKRSEEKALEFSLVIEDLATGEGVRLNADKVHLSASTIKIPVMMTILEQEGKEFSLDDRLKLTDENKVDFSVVTEIGREEYTIGEYMTWMMTESCNASTNVLIDLAGYGAVRQTIERAGMTNTLLQRKMMDVEARRQGRDNLTTAEDMAKLIKAMYFAQGFDKKACIQGLELMKQCRNRNLLLRYIPEPVEFAHKSGGLDEVSHDVGIFLHRSPIVVTALVTNSVYEEENIDRVCALGHLGRDLWEEGI